MTTSFKVIRTDGSESIIDQAPTLDAIYRAIGCTCSDHVTLSHSSIMIVDDTGMIDGKPVNVKATALYHAKCKPGTTHQIHGDVAIITEKQQGP